LARALIVGCGCRGRALGAELADDGWQVRGTTRAEASLELIRTAGIEPALADPERPGTVLELVGDVTVVHWLLGSADGQDPLLDAIHGPRLRALLERLVDTPVRGFVYEAAGTVGAERLRDGAELVREAGERWRIPAEVVMTGPGDPASWLAAMADATRRLLA
jgi:uncharacterized protein YbjT (DUF2867 family)